MTVDNFHDQYVEINVAGPGGVPRPPDHQPENERKDKYRLSLLQSFDFACIFVVQIYVFLQEILIK